MLDFESENDSDGQPRRLMECEPMRLGSSRDRQLHLAGADEWRSNASSAEKPAGSPERVPDMTLSRLSELFADRSAETRVKKFLCDVATLRAWQSETHASNKIRDAMTKLGSKWNVTQKAHGKKKAPGDIATDLERDFLAYAERLWKKSNPFSTRPGAGKPAPEDTLLERRTRPRKYSEESSVL
jgi:hypothetical protein